MRRAAFIISAVVSLGACRLFVDLDGLGDGTKPGAADDGGSDTSTPVDSGGGTDTGGGTNDSGVDAPAFDAGEDVDASKPCPNGGGPTMVRIPTSSGSFCIDTTEVTNAQYAAFLATTPSTAGQGTLCDWNTSFVPKGGWPAAGGKDNFPVGYVNWCDAAGFCKWAGKRLCGKVGTGAGMTQAEMTNNTVNEFAFACSHGGANVYPYGNTYDGNKCNGGDDGVGLEAVQSRLTCESGYGGVYDLAGNVHEWANGCVVTADPKTDPCALQNSAFTHPMSDMGCASWYGYGRANFEDEVGFRCCSD